MKIRDFCVKEVVTIEPADSLRVAAELMRTRHVGSLVVVEDRGDGARPVGILTDRDIVVGVVAVHGAQPEKIRAGDVMQSRVAVVGEDDGVFDALKLMSERGVRRLPVVAGNGTLRGLVSADDLVRVLSAAMGNLAAVLQRGAEREALERRLDSLLHRHQAVR